MENVRIVLVNTSHPGNIGACARAMKTMGLSRLALVEPLSFPDAAATARASGAADLLEQAEVTGTLEQALEACQLVIGASARSRTIAWPEVDARECGRLVAASGGEVALVFGRERTGLTNEELEYCHYLVHIPSNPDYSSLNVAAAVQVLSYELAMAFAEARGGGGKSTPPMVVGSEDMARFYEHLLATLELTEFYDPQNPKQLVRRLKRMFNRLQPDKMEMNILRGILTSVQNRIDGSGN